MNEVIQGDALAVLRTLPAESFACIVTSPPYNLGDRNPPSKSQRQGVRQPGHLPIEYAGDFADNLPASEYVQYHRDVVGACLAALKPAGLMWYVHRRRPVYNPDGLPSLAEQVLAGFPVRSEIIWVKGPGMNHCTAGPGKGYYYPAPAYESIFLLAKDKSAVLEREIAKYGDVWNLKRQRNGGHPAAFPQELAGRCIAATAAPGPVLDPFMGSGTTAVAAMAAGRDWLGIEQSGEYVRLTREQIKEWGMI